MAKRFTDTEKWRKQYVKSLHTVYKLLWLYILDECDHAGIWHVEMDIASLRIGEKLNPVEAIKLFGDHIIEFDKGEKWFIPDFIRFQYGELNPAVKTHNSVIQRLKKYNLIDENLQFINSIQTVKDKDKDMNKDMDKVKDKDKEREKEKNPLHIKLRNQFLEFYENSRHIPYLWSGVDGKSLNEIIKKIKFIGKIEDEDQINNIWIAILEKNPDKWINEHLSIAIINSKFNEIVSQIKGLSGNYDREKIMSLINK